MRILLRPLVFGSVAVLWNCGEPQPSPTTTATPGAAVPLAPITPFAAALQLGVTPLALDDAGVPHLVRGGEAMPRMRAVDATTSARMHVERLAPVWGVAAAAVPPLEPLGEVAFPGATIVKMRQVIDGIPVDRDSGGEVNVMVRDDGALVAASGVLIASDTPHAAASYPIDEAAAIATAVSDLYQTSFAPARLAMADRTDGAGGAKLLVGADHDISVSLSRAQKVWFPDGKTLIPAYVVEAYSSDMTTTDGDAYRTVVAADGRILDRTNLKVDAAFRYRVFAETTGELHPFDGPIVDITPHAVGIPGTVTYPAYVQPNLITVDGLNHPGGSATPDPWLANGRTETIGNNVEAYTDINPPDGLTFGDFRATITAASTFDRTFDTSHSVTATQAQQMAGITSLFYTINWLHDFWYDAGFTETAGNGQNNNLGRGGQQRDAMNAEAQDNANGGSRNNANMSTPADGMPPRMQVFVWDGGDDRSLGINRRKPITGRSAFGNKQFELTAEIVLANDGDATGGTTTDACQPLTTPAAAKIVLVDRGGPCSNKAKALTVQNAGGVAMILADNVTARFPPTLAEDAAVTTPITIGAMSVLLSEGDTIKAELAVGPVSAQMHRNVAPDLEGTLDATVVSHEFAHYLHHRLSVCNTTLCGAMSEGWADFDSLLVMSRAGDDFNAAFPVGTYSTQSFIADPVYFGIRRAPYSANLDINPLTFRHMANGVPLPAGTPEHPFNPNANPNAEVHNGGEVWVSMLWQGYSALQQQPGAQFETVRRRMQQYVVQGLLLAPTDATPTETRDAILGAVHVASPTDHDVLAAAYAKRGFGSCAVSPVRNSTNFAGIVESFEVKGRLAPGVPTLQSVARCDSDDVLDAGETGRIAVQVANPGPAALADVNVTLTSTTPGIHITRATVPVGALAAYGSTTATFNVQLDDTVTGAVAGDFTVTTTTSNGCNATVVSPLAIRLNTDDVPQASATDTFDAGSFAWTTSGSAGVWAHSRKTALDGFLFGADATIASDASIVSPPLIAGTGPVTVAFDHAFSFEANAATAFDGGVVEVSTDNATTWQDISTITNPGYNVTLGTNAAGNPLAGRPAFGRTSPGFPAATTVSLNLGTALAGKTFRLRFRAGSDNNTGGPGWNIDNVAFTGIIGTPFPALVADPGHCNAVTAPPDTSTNAPDDPEPGAPADDHADAGCNTGGSGLGLGLGVALGLLALRRRR